MYNKMIARVDFLEVHQNLAKWLNTPSKNLETSPYTSPVFIRYSASLLYELMIARDELFMS